MNVLKEFLAVLRLALTPQEASPALVGLASYLKVIIADAEVTLSLTIMIIIIPSTFNAFIIDIDECRSNTDGCSQVCTNTVGSYVCSCNSGYRLSEDRHTCNGNETRMSINGNLNGSKSSDSYIDKCPGVCNYWKQHCLITMKCCKSLLNMHYNTHCRY